MDSYYEDLAKRVKELENKVSKNQWKVEYWDIATIIILGSGLYLLLKDIWYWIFR